MTAMQVLFPEVARAKVLGGISQLADAAVEHLHGNSWRAAREHRGEGEGEGDATGARGRHVNAQLAE